VHARDLLDEIDGALDVVAMRRDATLEQTTPGVLDADLERLEQLPHRRAIQRRAEQSIHALGIERDPFDDGRRRAERLDDARRDAAAAELAALGFETRSGEPESLLAFAEALLGAFRRIAAGGEAWLTGEALAAELLGLLSAVEHDPVTRLPDDFVMLARVFGTLGGLFQHHRPRIDWGRHLAPVLGAAWAPAAQSPGMNRSAGSSSTDPG